MRSENFFRMGWSCSWEPPQNSISRFAQDHVDITYNNYQTILLFGKPGYFINKDLTDDLD